MRWRWWSPRAAVGGPETPGPSPTSIGPASVGDNGSAAPEAPASGDPHPPAQDDAAPGSSPPDARSESPGPGGSAPVFIGRSAELGLFQKLLDGAAVRGSAFVHLTGTPRSGRQALLEHFSVLAKTAGARYASVVDFEEDAGLELDQLLERIARQLEPERESQHFKPFFEAITRFHSKESGQPSRTSQAVAVIRAGSSAVSQLAGALPITLPFKAVDAAIQGPLGDVLTERAETRRTLGAVSEEFVGGLVELARARGPVVLLFSDLDFAPASAKVLWLRRSLLPRIAGETVIVAASTQPRFDLDDVGVLFGRAEKMHLDRFSQDEAEEFLDRRIGLRPGSPLARAVLEDANRFPERLAGYARYFDEHPEARHDDHLPAAARDLTAGGFVSGLLARVPDQFLRDVLLHAAPLRWFNAELLAGIETLGGLARPADGPHAAAVLDAGMRPSWVTNVGGGWGIDDATRRRAIVDEFRRLHPGLYRRVHLHAAGYHVARLRELEGAPVPPGDSGATEGVRVFAYQPIAHPTDRLRWDEYLASLGEWLYHLVALSPRAGFARLADYVGEALAWGYPAPAVVLLDIGVEIMLPASEALARQRLLEVARALQNDRHAETLQLLAEFSAGGSASAIADAAARYLVGTRLIRLGRSPLTVHHQFEQAEKLLAEADAGVQARSLRCLNLTRLASDRAQADARGEAALTILDQAAALARTLDPRVQAEVERTRGLVLAGAGRPVEALAACDAALDLLGRVGAAADAALVLCLRADVNLRGAAGPDAAREDLVRARSIYRQLVDPEAEAQVLIALLEIAVIEGDGRGAAELEATITLLRPSDFLVRGQIGSLYYHAERHEQAIGWYSTGLELAGEAGDAALFAYRGRARLKRAAQLETAAAAAPPPPPSSRPPPGGPPTDARWPADELRRQAREDLAAAFAHDRDDLDVGIELAELERGLGAATAAVDAALVVARRIVVAGRALPPPPPPAPPSPSPSPEDPVAGGAERDALTGRLRDILVRAATLLGPEQASEVLDGWMAAQAADEELELMRAIAGHELSAAAADGPALGAAILAAGRAAGRDDPPRGRALVELAALEAKAGHWAEAKAAARRAARDETVRVQAEYVLDRLDQMHRREDEFGGQPETVADELVVYVSEDLLRWFDPESPVGSEFFGWMIEGFHRGRQERLGLRAPRVLVDVSRELAPGWVQVVLDGVSRARLPIRGDLIAAASPDECRRRAGGADGPPGTLAWSPDQPATWLPNDAADGLADAGIAFWDPRRLILATVDQVLEATPRFISAEEAGSLSGESWKDLSPGEHIARAEVVRALLAGRVRPRDVHTVLAAYDQAPAAGRAEVVADAVARLGVPRTPPSELAAAFAATRFERRDQAGGAGGRASVDLTVRLGTAADRAAVETGGRRVTAALCSALCLPEPDLVVEADPELGPGGVAVAVAGVTRLVARPADPLDWWRCHPAAGGDGRTGLAGRGSAGTAVRAIEAALWDDPALLLHGPEVARNALGAALGAKPSDRLIEALSVVAGHRAPLGPPARLKRAREHVLDKSYSGLRLPAARTFSQAPRRPVPDNLPFGIRDTIHVDERGRLRQFGVRVQLHHDTESDLRVSLTSPGGLTVLLHDRGDDIGILRAGVDEERLPALAPLLNQPAEGDWTLHVQDLASRDAGLLEEWAIELTTASSTIGQPAPSAAPEIALAQPERDALDRCASFERDLRTRRIEALSGAELWAELEHGVAGGRLERERERLSTHLARELGLRFGHSIHFDTAAGLGPRDFRIVVNGLARASGDLPPGRYGQLGEDQAVATEGDAWVGPLSGLTHRRLGDDVPGGFDSPERLARHVRAAAREAAEEFADADWASAFLDRLAHLYPVTVPAVRAAAGDDLLGAVLRELVTQGVAVADPRLMELIRQLVRSPELARECRELAAAPEDHIGRTAGAMSEWLRGRLGRREPQPGVPVLELGPAAEAAVRAAVGSERGRVPVYALPSAGDILRLLEEARLRLGAAEIAVVTDASLRRHVHRLVAAQFPTAGVIARQELDPAQPRELVDLTHHTADTTSPPSGAASSD